MNEPTPAIGPMPALRGPIAAALLALALLPGAAPAHEGHDDERPAAAAVRGGAATDAHSGAAADTRGRAVVAAPGAQPTPSAPAPAGAPRFAATSDAFELVGALDGRRLTLWLDRFADNAPVAGATIELEVGEQRVVAQAAGDAYQAELPAAPPVGRLPIAATVTAGDASDLLAAELVVSAPAGAFATPADAHESGASGFLAAIDGRTALVALVAALAAGVIGWTAARRRGA